MVKRARLGFLAVLFATAAIMAGNALPARADTTILYANDNDAVHHCEVLGHAVKGYEAVICVDISTWGAASTGWAAQGTLEAYCQTVAGVAVRCANMYAEGQLGLGDEVSGGNYTKDYACGHSLGDCPAARVQLPTNEFSFTAGGGDCVNSTAFNIWMLALGGNTQIELPVSDTTFELDASDGANDGINYSSGHYQVCG